MISRRFFRAVTAVKLVGRPPRVDVNATPIVLPRPSTVAWLPQLQLSTEQHVVAEEAAPEDVHSTTTASSGPQSSKSRGRSNGPTTDAGNELHVRLAKINDGISKTGRVLTGDILKAFDLLPRVTTIWPNSALVLLRCLGSLLPDERPTDRTQRALELWKLLEDKKVALDVSHYNALLRIHVENEHNVSPTDFLSWMEGKGIAPNRVTFQHMIAKFCQVGNIAEATTILEHMKNQSMAINEDVFNSLVSGHCIAGDFETAKGVIQVMQDSGISVGAHTYLAYLVGMIRNGQEWESVKSEMEEIERDHEIAFSDNDIFEMMIEFIRAKKTEAARELLERLPRKRGLFQEMRNAIPRMIFAGEDKLPFEIFMSHKVVFPQNVEHPEARSRDNGLFILRAMVRVELDLDRAIGIVRAMMEENINTDCVSRMLETCIELDKLEYGKRLTERVKQEFGDVHLAWTPFHMRDTLSRVETASEIVQILLHAKELGLRILSSSISEHVMPKLLNSNDSSASLLDTLKLLSDDVTSNKSFSWTTLTNCALQYLLNQETKQDLETASWFALSVGFPSKPIMWNASLARSYLASKDVDNLISVLFASRHKRRDARQDIAIEHDVNIMKTLAHVHTMCHRYNPQSDPDSEVATILHELKKHHMGLPTDAAETLKSCLKDDRVKTLVEELEDIEKDFENYWTPTKRADFIEQRRQLLKPSMTQRKGIVTQRRVVREDLPDTIPELEEICRTAMSRGIRSSAAVSKLVEKYMDGKEYEKCKTLIEEVVGLYTYNPDRQLLDSLVAHLIDNDRLDDTEKLLLALNEKMCLVFQSTVVALCQALAQKGQTDKVIEFLEKLNPNALTGNRFHMLCHWYSQHQTMEEFQRLKSTLADRGFFKEVEGAANTLIDFHVNNGDLEQAVQEFERCCREEKRIRRKFHLMSKLIEAEDMDKMQRVLDASITVIGEEKSLYDLAHSLLSEGKLTQAKKVLETPGMRYDKVRIAYISKKLIEEDKLPALESFVSLTRGLFGCNRVAMYRILLQAFQDNPDKVMEIWLNMQEENVPPTEAMLRKVAACLEKHGRYVPFQVPPKTERVRQQEPQGEEDMMGDAQDSDASWELKDLTPKKGTLS